MKREGNLFDATMGAYDGAEVCELVSIFMLNKISEKYNKNDVGLYRDDGLAVFKNIRGPKSECIKKNFQSLFKKYGLETIIECNKKNSRLSRRHFQPQRWNLRAIPQTR